LRQDDAGDVIYVIYVIYVVGVDENEYENVIYVARRGGIEFFMWRWVRIGEKSAKIGIFFLEKNRRTKCANLLLISNLPHLEYVYNPPNLCKKR
jgi:hypothetical protein